MLRDANFNYTIDRWYHIATSYDGTDGAGVSLYIDGVLTPTFLRSGAVSFLADTAEPHIWELEQAALCSI